MKRPSRRKLLLLAFMIAFMVLTEIGFYIPVENKDAQALYDQFMGQLANFDSVEIAIHNLTIALVMFIPGVGLLFGIFTAVETGFAFHVANVVQTLPFEIHPALVLLITPFGILEWVAYGIGISRSYMILRVLIRRNKINTTESLISKKSQLRLMLKPTLIEIGIVIGLLLAGGFIEHWMIENGMGFKAIAENTGV